MIPRASAKARVRELFREHPCVAVLGPRQCGKTTLVRLLGSEEPECTFFDLESSLDACKLRAPMRTLGALGGSGGGRRDSADSVAVRDPAGPG